MKSAADMGLATPPIAAASGELGAADAGPGGGGAGCLGRMLTFTLAEEELVAAAAAADMAPGLMDTAALGSSGIWSTGGIATPFAVAAPTLALGPKSLSMTANRRLPSGGSSAINSSFRFSISSTDMPICLLRSPRSDSRSSGPTAPESTISSSMSTAFSMEGPPMPPGRDRSRLSPLVPPIIDFIARCIVSCMSFSAFSFRILSSGARRETVSKSILPPGVGPAAPSSPPMPIVERNSGVASVRADEKMRSSFRRGSKPS
mmetsp:Transcript_430/g.1209  ORF Transcript_430/g.1209 Transcript_430/m.1209 type:complete len:261 (-) Transcript_430:1382-2164(-)